ncbi:MAG: ankyrin repeat domain-containing protein [Flavobacterium sp.]|nr:ankyrin repeat domain-containing protein [Flavobacterium sp.]
MKNAILIAMLVVAFSMSAQHKNTLLDASFWKANPSTEAVKAEIAKGNSPIQANGGGYDPVSIAINNDAPLEPIKYLLTIEGNPLDKLTHDSRIYLHWAASRGNLELVQYLLAKGANVNAGDSHGTIPIAFAANAGMNNVAVYEAFFKNGIDPKKKYKDGANLLLLAVGNDKDLALTNYFTTKGMSIKDTDDNKSTAFDYAARVGNIDLLKTLLKKGVKPTDNALLFAAQGARRSANTLDVYQYLVDEVKLNPAAVSKVGENVLHSIVRKDNQLDIVNYFLSKGVDANKADNDGNTPLSNASAGKNKDIVELLASKSKNINLQNKKGETALTMAVKTGSADVAQLLIAKGADVKILDKSNNNLGYHLVTSYRAPRQAAPQDDFMLKINMLSSGGLDLAAPQADGNTLYHLAIAKSDIALLKKLDNLKIDVNAINQEGMTALHKAAMLSKDDALLKHLIALGAKKDIKTEFDETAFMLASENEFIASNKISIDFLKS